MILPGMEDISDTDGENENVGSGTSERTPLLPDQPRNHRRHRRVRRTRNRGAIVESGGSASLAPSSSSQTDPQTASTSALAPVAASVVAAVRSVFSSEPRHRTVSVDVNEATLPSGQYSVNCSEDHQVNPDPGQPQVANVPSSEMVSSDNEVTSSTVVDVEVTTMERSNDASDGQVPPTTTRQQRRRRPDNIV